MPRNTPSPLQRRSWNAEQMPGTADDQEIKPFGPEHIRPAMAYEIVLAPEAAEDLRALPANVRAAVRSALENPSAARAGKEKPKSY